MAKVELIKPEKSKFSENRIISLILIICAALIWLPIPISGKESAVALVCLIIGLYFLFLKG